MTTAFLSTGGPQVMSDAVKDRIGPYELLELLGDGAQGKVFKARCAAAGEGPVAQDEVVALKVLRVPPDDERAHQRFETQANILKRLAHPHIIRYRDAFTWHPGEWDEAQCLVMEYLEGETLASRLSVLREGGVPWPEVKTIFEQCLSGLIHAGREGIIHRDLKPSNIFLARDGSMRIFDFDIARMEGDSQRSTVGWKGSFDYMAPDFVTESDFHGDERSDIFSLGTCLYQALTGKLPLEPLGENAHIGYLNRWRNTGTPPELSFRAGPFRVLANAKALISRSLSPQRSRRYSSFAGMLADFQKIHYRGIQHMGKDTYELRDLLGRGGFGEVFSGIRKSDGQAVAIKHLFAERQSTRFIKEAKMLQRYSHPFLVTYMDFIEVQGATRETQYFLILELLPGMPDASLRYRIKQEGKLEPAEAMPLFMNYLDALSFLHGHSRPLIHRDIKPMNLYAPPGHPERAKIFDLGVARDVSGTVTSGGIPGTLDYMPPEFTRPGTGRGTPQSDLYALGLCLFEALTGQTAFSSLPPDINSAWAIFQERANHMPEVDYQARVFLMYPDLKAVVQKALASDPDARYARATAMQKDLESVLLRLDHPEVVPMREESTTVSASALLGPSEAGPLPKFPGKTHDMNAPRSAEPDTGRSTGEESQEPALPDLPDADMAGTAGGSMATRRKQMIRAAGVILILVAAGAGAVLWRARTGQEGRRPALMSAAAVPERPSSMASDALSTARHDMDNCVRQVRIPMAEAAYIENLVAAMTRVRQWGKRYPELAGDSEKKIEILEQHARDLPALFMSGMDMALAQKDIRKAETLLSVWRLSRRHAALMGLTPDQASAQEAAMETRLGRYRLDAAVAAVVRRMPSQLANEDDVAQAEEAAEYLEAAGTWNWPGITAAEKQARMDSLRTALTFAMKSGIAACQQEAVSRYRAGQDGAAWHAVLRSLPDDAPAALALASEDYRNTMPAVETARVEWDRLIRKQQGVLKAIEEGTSDMDRGALAALPVNRDQVMEVWAAASRVRRGFNSLALLDSEASARVFLAAAADGWKKASRCDGPLGEAIREAMWKAIRAPLVAQGARLLQSREMAAAGVRTPAQQARARRDYLRLLIQIETVTGRISGCGKEDPLRAQACLFFQRPFFHPALLADPLAADPIPWLADEFRKVQPP